MLGLGQLPREVVHFCQNMGRRDATWKAGDNLQDQVMVFQCVLNGSLECEDAIFAITPNDN